MTVAESRCTQIATESTTHMTVSHSRGSPVQFSASAWEVLRHRYLRKNAQGEIIETPEEMFRRVACTVAAVEANYDEDVAQWQSFCSLYRHHSIGRESMITLKLDDPEQQALVELLERELPNLRQEIHHTDNRDYKDYLKAREQLLERLLTMMKTTTTMFPSAPSSS